MMTEYQKDLLELFRDFGEDAQKAPNFVVKNSPLPVLKINDQVPATDEGGKIIFVDKPEAKPKDGVYIVYQDDHYELFDGTNSKENIKYVGIIHDGHSFCVGLKDLGEYELVQESDKCPKEHPLYRRPECEALIDWKCIERLKHIQEVGTDIPLADGEFIPSLPMLVVIRAKVKAINEALEYAGGEPLDKSFYWSCTLRNQHQAWGLYFYSGFIGSYSKNIRLKIRPIADFSL